MGVTSPLIYSTRRPTIFCDPSHSTVMRVARSRYVPAKHWLLAYRTTYPAGIFSILHGGGKRRAVMVGVLACSLMHHSIKSTAPKAIASRATMRISKPTPNLL